MDQKINANNSVSRFVRGVQTLPDRMEEATDSVASALTLPRVPAYLFA